jgi:LmbE family N-acetylglucosaminyl deacetylase
MQFHLPTAEIFIPDGTPVEQALRRTTHMAIGAHQDDLETMAVAPIVECFQHNAKWFCGVVMSDGRGSPRTGLYQNYNDEEMRRVRNEEQKKAAILGEYTAQVLLDYPSKVITDPTNQQPVDDLVLILGATHPEFVYTHNLADKHDTHVSVAMRVITAIRCLPEADRPRKLYGCEVWRDLDWLVDGDKVLFDLSTHENLQIALLGVFDSQISGGKRYDLAAQGRRRAHATFLESHDVDVATGMAYAMDLTPLIQNPSLPIQSFVQEFIHRFEQDIADRINRCR